MRFPLFVFPHRHPKASFEIRREGFFFVGRDVASKKATKQ